MFYSKVGKDTEGNDTSIQFSLDQITQVYSGVEGCTCGCNGEYRTTVRAKKMAMTRIAKLVLEGHQLVISEPYFEGERYLTIDGYGNQGNRVTTVYVQE